MGSTFSRTSPLMGPLSSSDEALLIEHFDVADVPNIALACFHSLMTSGVLVAAGVYLGRTGIMSREVTRGVAELTLRVTMPCLLFTRVVAAMDLELIMYAWPMCRSTSVFPR